MVVPFDIDGAVVMATEATEPRAACVFRVNYRAEQPAVLDQDRVREDGADQAGIRGQKRQNRHRLP